MVTSASGTSTTTSTTIGQQTPQSTITEPIKKALNPHISSTDTNERGRSVRVISRDQLLNFEKGITKTLVNANHKLETSPPKNGSNISLNNNKITFVNANHKLEPSPPKTGSNTSSKNNTPQNIQINSANTNVSVQ